MKARVPAVVAACLLAAACAKRVDDAQLGVPPEEPAAAPELSGGPDAAATAAQAAADANTWRTAEPYAPPPGLVVTYRYLPDGTRVMVISNEPIPNPEPRHLPRHRWTLDGAPRPRHAKPAAVRRAPVEATALKPAAAEPTPLPAPAVQPAPEVQQGAAAAADHLAPTPESAKAQAPAKADWVKGLMISPALWIVAGLALLIILILAVLSGKKPKRRPPTRLGDEAHA